MQSLEWILQDLSRAILSSIINVFEVHHELQYGYCWKSSQTITLCQARGLIAVGPSGWVQMVFVCVCVFLRIFWAHSKMLRVRHENFWMPAQVDMPFAVARPINDLWWLHGTCRKPVATASDPAWLMAAFGLPLLASFPSRSQLFLTTVWFLRWMKEIDINWPPMGI